ncbi:hypothetical protein SAMN05444166_7697 [Singulisphaera sp. GP187]|uniref:hypothetical protein n=1 Tax=Singulisphaera sp. GP187 TaxID=1882752 RepID=UPI0009292E74|nr:hypothetical protein [Singulisphaera sp. GP187]SIO65446.1 hypothetical protein SAMN05444166_7697 [Singulisphaera sp. GP187]
MIDEPDFSIEGEDPAPPEPTAAPLPPKVVIEYRDRGFPSLLVPPLLILLAVLGILVSRRETPIVVPPPVPPPIPTALVDSKPDRPASVEPARPAVAAVPSESAAASPAPSTLAAASALPELPDLDDLMPPLAASAASSPAPAGRHDGAESAPAIEKKPETPAAESAEGGRDSEPVSIRKPIAIVKIEPEPRVVAAPPVPPVAVAEPPPRSQKSRSSAKFATKRHGRRRRFVKLRI